MLYQNYKAAVQDLPISDTGISVFENKQLYEIIDKFRRGNPTCWDIVRDSDPYKTCLWFSAARHKNLVKDFIIDLLDCVNPIIQQAFLDGLRVRHIWLHEHRVLLGKWDPYAMVFEPSFSNWTDNRLYVIK